MDWRRVVLGIGNPGAEYADTRHNVGFLVLDRVAAKCALPFRRLDRDRFALGGKVKAQVVEGKSTAGESWLLVKPQTYVNCSGDVAGPLLRTAGLAPDSLFVVVDDLNLPLGRIRIRPSGSSGGHNGLESIEAALGTQGYPRLRLGIGAPLGSTLVDHVLASFLPNERGVLDPSLDVARDAVLAWLEGASVAELMDRCNGSGGQGTKDT